MKFIRRFSAVLIGIVFFVAGLLKLMDPVGAGLVVDEYFKFLHLRFLSFASKPLAVAFALVETLSGAALITGVWRKLVSAVVAAMLVFFTGLTLALVIFNPSMDCGCFGEAIHLTHMQSFIKNLILCALWALAFIPFRSIGKPQKIKYVSFSLGAAIVFFFTIHGLASIPMIDFATYSPGTELMDIDELVPGDARILSFSDADGQYCDSLALVGNVVIISSYDPDKLSEKDWARVLDGLGTASEKGLTTLLLVASTPSRMSEITDIPECTRFADRRDLMTLNRSNGGLTFISDGQIVSKWPAGRTSELSRLRDPFRYDPTDLMMSYNTHKRLVAQAHALGALAFMLIL